MKEKVLSRIEEGLLSIVTHEERPDIIMIEIDAGGAEEGIVPFLNIYGSLVLDDESLDEAIQTAHEQDEFGYIIDVLDPIVEDDFEIKLAPLYPEWPMKREEGDQAIVAVLKATVDQNKEAFKHIKKMYFSYVDNLGFVKIIDQPA